MLNFVDYNSESVISELVAQFEKALGETLQPSDERRMFLNQLAQVIIALNANINNSGNQVLLRYSRGDSLDAIGELFGVERLSAESAKCDLKFTLSAAQENAVVIPKGTRATPDGSIYFATDNALTIPAGATEGVVSATATVAGTSNNGYTIGQIKYIVDNVPFLSSVSNTTISTGGTDEEDDDSLRERIRLAPESFSTAGCVDGYIYWAKSAHVNVGDVSVVSPSAGCVDIYILKADGTIPEGEPWLNDVQLAVSAKDKRPLTDKVEVKTPTPNDYSINFEYYVSEDDELNVADIKVKVREAVHKYAKWQSEKIGRDINPDKLRSLVLNAGASRVILTSPNFTTLDNTKVAKLTSDISSNEAIDTIAVYKGTSE